MEKKNIRGRKYIKRKGWNYTKPNFSLHCSLYWISRGFLCVFFITKHSTFFHLLEWELGGGKVKKKQVLSIFHPVGGEPVQVNQLLFHCGWTQKVQVMLHNTAHCKQKAAEVALGSSLKLWPITEQGLVLLSANCMAGAFQLPVLSVSLLSSLCNGSKRCRVSV